MKNSYLLGAAITMCLALAMPVQAGFIGDIISGSGIQAGGTNIFSPSDVTTSNGDVEYLGALDGIFEPDGSANQIDNIRLQFDFLEGGGDSYLRMSAYRENGTGGIWEFTDLVVTFTDLDYSLVNYVLAGLEQTPEDPESPYFADPMQGFSAALGDDFIEFTFTDFRVDEARVIYFGLIFEEQDGGPSTPVVPVPAAAPMVLLGMGAIALARRVRRPKS